jgi:hypothetical protein
MTVIIARPLAKASTNKKVQFSRSKRKLHECRSPQPPFAGLDFYFDALNGWRNLEHLLEDQEKIK